MKIVVVAENEAERKMLLRVKVKRYLHNHPNARDAYEISRALRESFLAVQEALLDLLDRNEVWFDIWTGRNVVLWHYGPDPAPVPYHPDLKRAVAAQNIRNTRYQ